MPPQVSAGPRKGSLRLCTRLPDVMSICPWIVLVLIGTSISVAGENLSCTGAALPPLLLIPGCLLIAALVPGSASGGIRHPGTGFRRRPKRRAVI